MCGIAGVVSTGPSSRPLAGEAGDGMAACLRHRGPDGQTGYVAPSGRCVLGHTRLAVIDLDTGDQPMPNEDGSVQVVFNGEIYNFRRLRHELEGLGHRFETRSDTEVLSHGWEEWGEGVVDRLEGMFAFAVWDERTGTLFIARDRAGQKPVFLYRDRDRLAFASEIKSLLALPGADAALDPSAFPLYLAYGYVPQPRTFYRRVQALPPATWLRVDVDSGREEMERYWRLDFSERWRGGIDSAAERLRDLMEAAVERRLIADVPLGAFLSGGMDSSVIVGLMSRVTDHPVRTFSIGFEDAPLFDETSHAETVAEHFGTEHTRFRVGAQSVDLVERLVRAYDQPFGDSSAIPTHIVSGLAREHVTVALTGDAGDELFAGYARFRGMQIAGAMPDGLVSLGGAVAGLLPHDPDFRSFSRRAKRFFHAASLSEHERMLRWIGFFADRLDEMLRPELRELIPRHELTRSFRRPLERGRDLSTLSRTLSLNFETYLPEDLLVKIDRCSMAHGLELRSPFLDRDVMEFAAGLPDHYRIRGRTYKRILKRAFEDLLPQEILRRSKMGFGIPLPQWFRNEWRPLLEERILSDDARLWRWLEREPVERMAREHLDGRADYGHQLWALLTLEEWLEQGRYDDPGTAAAGSGGRWGSGSMEAGGTSDLMGPG